MRTGTSDVSMAYRCPGGASCPQKETDMKRTTVAAIATTLLVLGACSDSNESAEVEGVVRSAIAAVNAGDVFGYAKTVTDQALLEEWDMTREEFLEIDPNEFAFAATVTEVADIDVTGDTAKATLTLQLGDGEPQWVWSARLHLAKEGGSWKLAHGPEYEQLAVAVPSSAKATQVDLVDFGFKLESTTFDRLSAFTFDNEGAQEHEAVLMRLTNGVTLADALDAEFELEGLEFVAAAHADTGDGTSLVLTEDLEPGRYAFVCFIEDPADNVPHAFKGMTAEFTITS